MASAPWRRTGGGLTTSLDLVHRLIALNHLATMPLAGEMTAQWSSDDRTSRCEEATGKYANWAASSVRPPHPFTARHPPMDRPAFDGSFA